MTTDLLVTIQADITDMEGLEEVIAEMVAAAREHDPATLQYTFSIDDEKKTLFVMERYADTRGFMAHAETMGPFAARYFSKIQVVHAAIHSAPGVELPDDFKAALAPFGTRFMRLVDRSRPGRASRSGGPDRMSAGAPRP